MNRPLSLRAKRSNLPPRHAILTIKLPRRYAPRNDHPEKEAQEKFSLTGEQPVGANNYSPLPYNHRIAEAVEAILLRYRLLICLRYEVTAGERRYQHD